MNEFPKWEELTPESAAERLPKLLDEAKMAFAGIEENPGETFEIVHRLDDSTRELWHLWGRICHMLSVVNSDGWRKVEETFQPAIVEFSLMAGQSRPVYEAVKVLSGKEQNPTRKRILDIMCKNAELAGVALDGDAKERFNAIQARLAQLSMEFSNSVLDATKAFTLEKDGKTYTIDDAEYPQTMKHCADREVREALYRARVSRSPDNTARIDEILSLRAEMAALLGFPNYASLSLATKCAPSSAAVFGMFDELDSATKDIAQDEKDELGEGLEPWDIAYAAERLREKKYSYSEEELKQCFEFEDTLKGLFALAKFLFGVEVREVAARPQVWHKEVRFFEVLEAGATIAHFYLDPYVRNGEKRGGAWMNEFRNRDDRLGTTPLAVIVLNLPRPDENGKCFMPWREVETLFHEFGHALQCMLTRVAEEDAAGINLIEWDAVEVASQFMENWCLDRRTGIEVPADLKKKVLAAKNFRAATQCRRQLALGKTDMLLHSGRVESPDAVKEEVFTHFGMPMIAGDLFLNAFTHIFAGGYAAGYYGYKWSEVMSADCYGAFEDAGLEDDDAVAATGRKYRETILAMGGSKSAFDVFCEFRGRAPSTEALLRQQGLAKRA